LQNPTAPRCPTQRPPSSVLVANNSFFFPLLNTATCAPHNACITNLVQSGPPPMHRRESFPVIHATTRCELCFCPRCHATPMFFASTGDVGRVSGVKPLPEIITANQRFARSDEAYLTRFILTLNKSVAADCPYFSLHGHEYSCFFFFSLFSSSLFPSSSPLFSVSELLHLLLSAADRPSAIVRQDIPSAASRAHGTWQAATKY